MSIRGAAKHLAAAMAVLIILAAWPSAMAQAQAGDDSRQMAMDVIVKPWTGDLDGMLQRRMVRALVAHSKTNYFLDGMTQRGITYDNLMLFEKQLNAGLKKRGLKVHVLCIPVARDQLLPMLVAGQGDIAAAMLTQTGARQELVDFATPFAEGIQELVVTSPGAPKIASLDDLAGKTVYVRRSSSYYESLLALNKDLAARGKPPVIVEPADEYLETEDILEMVNADLIKITVADSHLAGFWKQIFTDITVRDDLVLRSGGRSAWAIRKNSPQLAAAIDSFVKRNKQGTLMGNMLIKRYLQDATWARRAISGQDLGRFKAAIEFFKQYAGQYSFDWLMIAALAYQESGLDQAKRSPDGAVGVMQIKPATAAAHPVLITGVDKLDKNIHAGVKYLRFIHDQNFRDDPSTNELNKVLFTFAAYNAGPARVQDLRARAGKMGLNPGVWFGNVELAAAKVIGRETVQYVANIYKYYIAYKQLSRQAEPGEKPKAAPR